jgi:hypothetical protein
VVVDGACRSLLDVSVGIPGTIIEVWPLESSGLTVEVAVLNQRAVVRADDFHRLLVSSSLYHVEGVPVIHP